MGDGSYALQFDPDRVYWRTCPRCKQRQPRADFGHASRHCKACREALAADRERQRANWIAHNIRAKFEQAPKRQGSRTLLSIGRRIRAHGDWEYTAHVVCDCGVESTITESQWKLDPGYGCHSCSGRARALADGRHLQTKTDDLPRAAAEVGRRRIAWVNEQPKDDKHYQLFMEAFPEGATLEMIADFYGITRERVRQIEAGALRQARKACQEQGLTLDDFVAGLSHPGSRRWRTLSWGEVQQPEAKH